jgi:hypothetical protein
MRHLQAVVGRIYHLLTKEAAYGPNLHRLDDFRAAQRLEKSLDEAPRKKEGPRERGGQDTGGTVTREVA